MVRRFSTGGERIRAFSSVGLGNGFEAFSEGGPASGPRGPAPGSAGPTPNAERWVCRRARRFDRVSRLPVLFVVTFRPEFQHAWGNLPRVTMLALKPLGGRDSAMLVEAHHRGRA
jgi:hypothetical protein